jgi:hypothetical protein
MHVHRYFTRPACAPPFWIASPSLQFPSRPTGQHLLRGLAGPSSFKPGSATSKLTKVTAFPVRIIGSQHAESVTPPWAGRAFLPQRKKLQGRAVKTTSILIKTKEPFWYQFSTTLDRLGALCKRFSSVPHCLSGTFLSLVFVSDWRRRAFYRIDRIYRQSHQSKRVTARGCLVLAPRYSFP